MLKQIEISKFEDRIPYLLSAHQKGFYIVSDIKSKIQFQNFLLRKESFIRNSCIKRASDFYCELLMLQRPEYVIISPSQLKFLFKTYLKKQKTGWFYNTPIHNNILNSLQTFLPFLIHPEGSHSFEQWTKESSYQQGWTHWYEITKDFWHELNKTKMIEKSLAKYLLIDQNLKDWKTPLIFDLGFSIDAIEAELFFDLSRVQPIQLLVPPSLQHPIYKNSHRIYSLIKEKSTGPSTKLISSPKIFQNNKNHSKDKKSTKTFPKKQIRKFQTMLEEIHFVTEQTRNALETGLKPFELTILAPNIELYWPCLKSYLKKEGIPVQKGISVSLISFPQIQKWLSVLHFYSGQISFENAENALTLEEQFPHSSQIRSKYYYCDRKQDIPEIPLKEKYQLCTVNEFLDWILNFWKMIIKKNPNPELEQQLQSLLNQLILPFSMKKEFKTSIEDWLEILENDLIQSDFHIQSENNQGISCISTNAITSLQAQQVHIIGLDHDSCWTPSSTFFSENETKQILNDLGFHCLSLDPNQKEYEIINFLNHFEGTVTLSYSEISFEERTQQPSRIWLLENEKLLQSKDNNRAQTSMDSQQKHSQTVWGSRQQSHSLENILKNSSSVCSPTQIQNILDQTVPWPKDQPPFIERLAAGSIKNYASCPFIFLSKKLFHLEDIQYRDMDLNPMDQGKILHDLFYQIKENKIHTEQDISQWVQSKKENFHLLNEEVWHLYTTQFLKKTKQFLEHEQKISQLLPEIQTIGAEITFKGYWNFEKEKLDSTGDVLIEGRIDRMDCYQNEYLIIDYKSSFHSDIVTMPSWEKKLDFQMPLYIQAVESSLLEKSINPPHSVSAAVYLNCKNYEWKGFVSKTSQLKKILDTPRSHSLIDKEKKDEILKAINKNIQKYILNIKANMFQPKPFDYKICQNCNWRKICRAPHLN